MKVLYLIDTLAVGGAERSLLDILRRFTRVTPVMCHLYPGDALKGAYVDAGVRVVSLDVAGRYGFARAARAVLDVVREERPDLIHATLLRASLVGRVAARVTGVPLVHSFVSDSYSGARTHAMTRGRRAKLRVMQALDRATAPLVHHYAANSHAAKAAGARALGVAPARVTVIHRGRDASRFAPDGGEARAALRAALGTDARAPVVLSVGRLVPEKGQDDLVRAMPAVRAVAPGAELWIAGEGRHRGSLEALVGELGLGAHVRLLGSRADVPDLLRAADVFALPSHYEGHSGALVEAMFAARPIVASDIAQNRESVAHSETAYLVPPRQPAALAAWVGRALTHPDEVTRMAQKSREVALERFDIARIATQHEELYARVLRASAGGRAAARPHARVVADAAAGGTGS